MLSLFCKKCDKKVDAEPLAEPKADFIATCPHCGSMLSPHRILAPGTEINGFRIEREIGRGGMGVVYLAKQLDLDRDIAFKVLSDEMASDKAFVDAFFREARAAAALNHPNVVQAIDAGEANDVNYFVMELIEGENLEVYTAHHGAMPTALALKCSTSIADALAYAWESKKLTHRDIKPENIIMKNDSVFKLADLGLAKECKEGEGAVESEEDLMATPAYASPEVIRREKNVPGFKSDMYSFGATLYQLFTGRAPFVDNDPMKVCEMQLENQPKPLIGINSELPAELSILVDKLMEKDHNKRPASWNIVLHELNKIAYVWHMTHDSDGKLKPEAVKEAETPKIPDNKHLLLWAGIVFLGILLLAEIIFFSILRFSDRSEEQTETENIAQNPSEQTIAVQPETPEQTVTQQQPQTPAEQTPVAQTPAQDSAPQTQEPPAGQKPVSQPEKVTVDDLPDDPEELANWQKNYKRFLPSDNLYARWDMIRDYLQDNPYAPKEARTMFKELEEGPKAACIARMKSIYQSLKKTTHPRSLHNKCISLQNDIKKYPLWADEALNAGEKEQIGKYLEKAKLLLAEEAEKRKAAEERRKQEQAELKKKREEQLRQQLELNAKRDFNNLRMICLQMSDKVFENRLRIFKATYSSLPNFAKMESTLNRLNEFRALAKKSIFEIIEENEYHFKNRKLFPSIYPEMTFKKVEDGSLIFIKKQGSRKREQTLHESLLNYRKNQILEDLIFNNSRILTKLKYESIAALILQAHIAGMQVKDFLKKLSGLRPNYKQELLELLDEYDAIMNED